MPARREKNAAEISGKMAPFGIFSVVGVHWTIPGVLFLGKPLIYHRIGFYLLGIQVPNILFCISI